MIEARKEGGHPFFPREKRFMKILPPDCILSDPKQIRKKKIIYALIFTSSTASMS